MIKEGKHVTKTDTDMRENELSVDLPEASDAQLRFIGRIYTPWKHRSDCPKQGALDEGPICTVEIFDPWGPALQGIEAHEYLDVLYWLDQSRRDLLVQNKGGTGKAFGTFALRSPVRPNPIGVSTVRLESVDGKTLHVRGLDCLDGTPLIDLKPYRSAF